MEQSLLQVVEVSNSSGADVNRFSFICIASNDKTNYIKTLHIVKSVSLGFLSSIPERHSKLPTMRKHVATANDDVIRVHLKTTHFFSHVLNP